MYVVHCTNELCEYLLHLLDLKRSMLEEVVVELIACERPSTAALQNRVTRAYLDNIPIPAIPVSQLL
jgi:hypothetical protein